MLSTVNKFSSPFVPIFGVLVLYFIFAYELDRSETFNLLALSAGLFGSCYFLVRNTNYSFWTLAGLGILFRLLFLPALPNLSQDFYRFLWDGRLLVEGVSPYLFTPEQFLNNLPPKSLLANWTTSQWSAIHMPQAQELYQGMGSLNGSHFSNYPPLNQLCFAVAALFSGNSILGSAIVLRILIILADIGILFFGKKLLESLGLPLKNIFWYFLNPFIIIELTGNLHFEGVMLFFLIWSLYLLHKGKWFWAAVLIGLSISVKLIPLLLLPIFFLHFFKNPILHKKEASISLRTANLFGFYTIVLATVVLAFAPFISGAFIDNFASSIGLWFQKFEFNASIYYIIRWIGFQTIGWNLIETVGKILPLVVILILLMLSFFRKNSTSQQLITGLLFGISCYFLLSTTVHPWYIATPLLLSVFTKYKFPIVWSFVVMFSYSAYGADSFAENLWFVALEYLVVLVVLIYELRRPSRNMVGRT